MKIQTLTPLPVNVSEKTNWMFVKVDADNGLSGYGECTLSGGWEAVQLQCFERLSSMIVGKTVDEALPLLQVYPQSVGGLVWNSVLSATEMALTDLRAREAGVPVWKLFCDGKNAPRDKIRVYGNINRAAVDRSPAGFAALARDRVAQGYTAIKLAPFDGVFWADLDQLPVKKNYTNAIDCVQAVRDAVGPKVDVLIDCHWRFDEASSLQLLRDLASVKLFWAECLVSERAEHHVAMGKARRAAEEMGVLVAGAERQVGVLGMEPLVRARLLDVVMPDVKYAGGIGEMLRIAKRANECGVKFSPHNPTGPICNLASLNICTLADGFLILERQSEGSLYEKIFTGAHPKMVDGCYEIPSAPGFGIDLNLDVIREHPPQKPRGESTADPRLG